MTYSFILAIERGLATTYGSMLNAMRSTIRDTTNELGGGILTSLISMFLTGRTYSGEITQVRFFTINLAAACVLHISPLQKLWGINFLIFWVWMCLCVASINIFLISICVAKDRHEGILLAMLIGDVKIFLQEPQLTASEQFDVYSKPFSL